MLQDISYCGWEGARVTEGENMWINERADARDSNDSQAKTTKTERFKSAKAKA